MLRVYILPVERINNTDTVRGIDYIHDAILTYDKYMAVLIQNTNPQEDTALSILAAMTRIPTAKEIASFNSLEKAPPGRNLAHEIDILKERVTLIEEGKISAG